MTDEQRASLNPEDFIEGGGLYDDVDAVIKKARFEEYDYNGTVPQASPALAVTIDVDEMGEVTEYWSAGSLQSWIPSKDGKCLLKVGNDDQLRKSTNAYLLLQSLINAERKFGKMLSDGDISVIDGTKVHLKREPAPERKGVVKTEKELEREKKFGPKTILLISEVLEMPGENGKGKKKATTKKASNKAADTESDADLTQMATDFVVEMIAEKDEVAVKTLASAALKKFKDVEGVDYMAIVKLVATPDFQNNADAPWTNENGMLKLA